MSTPLSEIIREEIAASGPIPFRRFMELALYHPEHGYYGSGRARVGRSGDFFTNVSVGPLFGKLLARQFAEMWELLGKPTEFSIVEQGAHEGHFAHDACTALRGQAPECFAALRYRIVEPSERLAALQRERLAGLPVVWVSSLEALPRFVGVHFSNELVDAFPVHLVRWNGAEWEERHVEVAADGFAFSERAIESPELIEPVAQLPQPITEGYTTEVNLAAGQWISEVTAKLVRGYVLAIDYGHLAEDYYRPDRVDGTLSAYKSHRREADPLQEPGMLDLTAHVDFTALMESGKRAGMRFAGFADQHHFMVGLGAIHFPDGAPSADMRAFQTLMHPTMMGMAFKVVAFAKGDAPEKLQGFRFARLL